MLSGVNILYPLITFPYIARVLAPEGLGQTQFAFNFALYFSVLASFGIPFYGINEIGKSRGSREALNKTFSELVIINCITAVISASIYLATIFIFDGLSIQPTFTFICFGLIILTPLNIDWAFSGIEKFDVITLRAVFIKLIALFLLFIFVKSKTDLSVYLAILVFSYVGNYLFNILLLNGKFKLTFSDLSLKKHRTPLLFILSTTFATTIYTSLDSVVLGLLSSDLEVGLYTAGVKLSKVSIPIVTGLSAVLVPRIAQAIKDKNITYEKEMVDRSFSFIVFIGIPISIGMFVFKEDFILIFSGDEYIGATGAMGYLSFLPIFIGLGYLFGFQVLVPNNLNKPLFISTMFGAIIFFILNFVFTAKLGAEGAALTILITEIIVTSAYFFYSPKTLRKNLPLKEVLFATLSSIPFLTIEYILGLYDTNLSYRLPMAITLCVLIYFIVQYFIFKNLIISTILNTIRAKVKL